MKHLHLFVVAVLLALIAALFVLDRPRQPTIDSGRALAAPLENSYGPDLTTSGNCIDGGHASTNVCGRAFDDNSGTAWASSQTGAAVIAAAYVGQNFGSDVSYVVSLFTLKQGASGNEVGSVKVQAANGSCVSWDTIAIVSVLLDGNVDTYPFASSNTYQCWRLLANDQGNITTLNWAVYEMEMEANLATSTPLPGTATLTPTVTLTPSVTPTPTTDFNLYATTTQGAPIRLERSATFGDIGNFGINLVEIVIALTAFALWFWKR
jgi:hypothetical protein